MQLRSASGSPTAVRFPPYIQFPIMSLVDLWNLTPVKLNSFSRVLEQDPSAMIDSYLFLFFFFTLSSLSAVAGSLLSSSAYIALFL